MSDIRVASRYAKSVIDLAIEKGCLDEVHTDMLSFAKVCNENRELVTLLKSPIVKSDKKSNILISIFGGKVSDLTLAFFKIITQKGREQALPSIADEVHNQYNILKGVQKAEVITASPIDATLRAEFTKLVVSSTGKTVELKESIDPELIGGYILRIADEQIDESIKSKLNNIKVKFSSNSYISKI
jgi:F-type H+-transporting ATPase subunit delta